MVQTKQSNSLQQPSPQDFLLPSTVFNDIMKCMLIVGAEKVCALHNWHCIMVGMVEMRKQVEVVCCEHFLVEWDLNMKIAPV